jgi:hypothetical protein
MSDALVAALSRLGDRCRFCIATGNDLEFVTSRVPAKVLDHIEAVILETGAVAVEQGRERILASEEELAPIRGLERQLRAEPPEGVLYFARRLATISLFTRSEAGGTDPARLFPRVKSLVGATGLADEVTVTHSDVAVDIIPGGFSKYTGLKRIAGGSPVIGIADSLNDLVLIRDTDLAFVPANASPALLEALDRAGRSLIPLADWKGPADSAVGQSGRGYTEGVLEILTALAEHLPQEVGPVGDDGIDPEP